jgi:hypothetical protein
MTQWFRTTKMLEEQTTKSASDGIGYNDSYLKQIKLSEAAVPLLFVEGDYPSYKDASVRVPYFEFPRHTFKETRDGKPYIRSFLCAKDKEKGIKCPTCQLQYDKEDKRISTRIMRYFNVIALDWFYLHTNDYGDQIYKQPETPSQRRQWDERGIPKVFGRNGYLEFGPGHSNQLIDIASQVGNTCAMCVAPGKKPSKLFPSKYRCGACNSVAIDMETTNLSKKELDEASGKIYRCKCGHSGLLEIEYECETCKDPKPAEIFDVVIPLAKRGKDTDTSIVVPHGNDIVFIDHYKIPTAEGDAPLFNGDAFHPSIQALYTALDFNDLFKVEKNPLFHEKMMARK